MELRQASLQTIISMLEGQSCKTQQANSETDCEVRMVSLAGK